MRRACWAHALAARPTSSTSSASAVRSLAGGRVVKTTLATSASGACRGAGRWSSRCASRSPTAAGASPSATIGRPARRQGARPRGLEVAARAMRLGERARVKIDAEYGSARRATPSRRAAGRGARGGGDAAPLAAHRPPLAPPPKRARRHRRRRRAAGRRATRLPDRERARPHASVGAGAVHDGRRARGVRARGGGEVSGPYKLENTDEVDGARWWTLGRGLAIEGVERALIMMRPGESAELRCPPALAATAARPPSAWRLAPTRASISSFSTSPPPPELCAPGALDGAAEALRGGGAQGARRVALWRRQVARGAAAIRAAAAAAAVAAKAAEKADHDGGDDAAEQAKQLRVTALSNAALCWPACAAAGGGRCATAALELDPAARRRCTAAARRAASCATPRRAPTQGAARGRAQRQRRARAHAARRRAAARRAAKGEQRTAGVWGGLGLGRLVSNPAQAS